MPALLKERTQNAQELEVSDSNSMIPEGAREDRRVRRRTAQGADPLCPLSSTAGIRTVKQIGQQTNTRSEKRAPCTDQVDVVDDACLEERRSKEDGIEG